MAENIKTLEKGDIYFFYRPKVEEEHPDSRSDVQRMYMVLSSRDHVRLTVVGHKKLPDPEKSGHRQFWGFVDLVRKDPGSIVNELKGEKYGTKTRGERHLPQARPMGEGVYRLLVHEDHTHLVYELELPEKLGNVQKQFNIEKQASYIISIKNPEKGSPGSAGLSEDEQARLPKHLMEVFRDRKFANADPPEFLNHEGVEFILISASENVKQELGIDLDTEKETLAHSDLVRDLKVDREQRPTQPLTSGSWM